MKALPILLSILVLAVGFAPSAIAQESQAAPARTVSVAGTVVTRTVPDVIVWHINTHDFDKDLVKAKNSSDAKVKAILGLKEEMELDDLDIQTGYLNIQKEWNRDKHGNRTDFKHFAVHRNVTIKQRDIKKFDQMLTRLVGSAEMDVNFSFESSKIYELRRETRLKAIGIARDKAEAMTEALGVKLGKVVTIQEYLPDNTSSRAFLGNNASWFDPGSAAPELDASAGTFAPGSIEVRITVYVMFAIE